MEVKHMKMKLERIAINVKNLDEAKKFFSDLLNTTFEDLCDASIMKLDPAPPGTFKRRSTVSPLGIELYEPYPTVEKEGVRNITWRVDDLEEAKEWHKKRGIRQILEVTAGAFKAAVFNPEDVYGVRWAVEEYEGKTALEAQLKKPK